ncbi:MAG TPA: hypothetical protein VH913_25960 [Hyphomicrobiaceae bacterium]|jgi:hypothetical protein
MRAALTTAIVVAAAFAALPQPASARCANGYEAVWVQGNQVCRLKTPKLPLKAKQNRSRSKEYPKHLPVESWSF